MKNKMKLCIAGGVLLVLGILVALAVNTASSQETQSDTNLQEKTALAQQTSDENVGAQQIPIVTNATVQTLIGTGIASAQTPPNFPVILKGSVSIGGNPAPPGTQIFAKVGDTIVGSTVVQSEGKYGDTPNNLLPVSADDGAQVDIYVNDMIITSFTYHLQDARAGRTFQVDLIVPNVLTPVLLPYYKCYKIERQVNLRTQFGFEQGVDVQENGEFLCAPALLNDTSSPHQQQNNLANLQNTYPHLRFYAIDAHAPAINVPVLLSSSLFGNETVNVTQPVFLGLPAVKMRTGKPTTGIPPNATDLHYKCYVIEPNTRINKEVSLVTQFGEEKMIVRENRFLCAPALKNPSGNVSQQNQTLEALGREFPHLKLYNIESPGKPNPINIPVNLTTQFGTELNVNITTPLYLAVPVAKEVGKCDLAINKTVSPNPVVNGQQATVNITVTNGGNSPCEGVTNMTDSLPAGLQVLSAQGGSLWNCGVTGANPPATVACTWNANIQPVPPGSLPQINITVNVTAPPGSNFTNCGTVTNPNDSNPANNQACVTIKCTTGCDQPPSGMVSWWPGDGNANDIMDGNNGLLMNGATYTTGKVGQGFLLNGVSSFVMVPYSPNLDPGNGSFTVDAWINTSNNTGTQDIVYRYDCGDTDPAPHCSTTSLYGMGLVNGYLSASIRDTSGNGPNLGGLSVTAINNPLATNTFYHVAMVRNIPNNSLDLYLNGALVASSALMGSNGKIWDDDHDSDPLEIGAGRITGSNDSGAFFKGIIDEVEYYNRALNQTEIEAIYNASSAGKCKNQTGTICGVKFNDLNGNGIQDANEPGLANWTIQIIYPNGTVAATAVTDAAGGYCVTVPAGNYTISEVPQVGWTQTYPLPPGTYTVNLTASQTMQNVSFGNSNKICCNPPSGMVSWWKGDGNANDTWDGNHGTLQNGATAVAAGKVGLAFSFNGNLQFVEVPTAANLNITGPLTIDAWVFPAAVDGEINIIINKEENPSNIQYELGIRGTKAPGVGTIPVGNLTFFLGGISVLPGGYKGWVDGGGPVPLNTWTHVALTFDGNSTRVYINGVLTRTVTGLSGLIGVTSGPLRIGFRSNVVPSYESFNGSIDEVEIFNRALNQTDIQAIFNASSAGKCCGTPVRLIPGLDNITFWESTVAMPGQPPTPFTFALNSPQQELKTRLPGVLTATTGHNDFKTSANEFYDVFYSDADGTFNLNGRFVSIEAVFDQGSPSGGGLNIAEVQLNFNDGTKKFANSVASYVALGDNQIPGDVGKAVDGDLLTDTTMGNTNNQTQRLRVTVGFPCCINTTNITLNTGFNQTSGGIIGYNQGDDDWNVVVDTVNPPVPRNAIVVPTSIGNQGNWPPPFPNSRWISVNPARGYSSYADTDITY